MLKTKITPLYERLSRDDELQGESNSIKPAKREQYQQEHKTELASFNTAVHFLDDLKASGEKITPKAWRAEVDRLTEKKDLNYQKMRAMRGDLKAVESLRKTAERLANEGQNQHDKKSEER